MTCNNTCECCASWQAELKRRNEKSVRDLDLSVRALNLLEKMLHRNPEEGGSRKLPDDWNLYNVTLHEVSQYSIIDFRHVSGVGKKVFNELRQELNKFGFDFKRVPMTWANEDKENKAKERYEKEQMELKENEFRAVNRKLLEAMSMIKKIGGYE